MEIGNKLLNQLNVKRYHCSGCGYTWIEYVGHIVEKREGLEDMHFRIGDGAPSECQKCGCCFIFEITLAEANQHLKGNFEGIRRILREIEED